MGTLQDLESLCLAATDGRGSQADIFALAHDYRAFVNALGQPGVTRLQPQVNLMPKWLQSILNCFLLYWHRIKR